MKWSKPVALAHGLRLARLHPPPPPSAAGQIDPALEQAAYERGFADGEKHLSEQLLRQRAELLELQNGVLASLRQAVSQVVRQSEGAVVQLALEVARKLVEQLPITPEMIEASVRSALAQVEESTRFEIDLHAEDLALLQSCHSPLMLPGPGNDGIEFRVSPEVTRGGCLVHTRFGVVDARRETKLELVRQALEL
jgi:flagellar assembly protein FliH